LLAACGSGMDLPELLAARELRMTGRTTWQEVAVKSGGPAGPLTYQPRRTGRGRQVIMSTLQSTEPGQPTTPQSARPRNGVGVAALVLGVASLVAALSFVLFPLALLG